MTDNQADSMVAAFVSILKDGITNPTRGVATLEKAGVCDKERITLWNNQDLLSERVDRCVHEVIQDRVTASPDADAVCAWDGTLSYAKLDELSTRLAYHLISNGVQSQARVLVCLERSMWTPVAILAVLKTGATFVPVDPATPPKRIRDIASRAGAILALVDKVTSQMMAPGTVDTMVELSDETHAQLAGGCSVVSQGDNSQSQSTAQPTDAAYIIFTSGSTGVPKGVVIEHATVSSSCHAHGQSMNISSASRVFHFTSLSFDVSMAELLTTLTRGGCICVPSETQRRSDPVAAMNHLRVNWAFSTPSLAAALLRPQDLPLVKTLVLGGEALTAKNVEDWASKVQLINGFGPSEACIFCISGEVPPMASSAVLGRAIGSVAWIADVAEPSTLAPIGAVGELLVQGPVVGRGYLHDDELTNKLFLSADTLSYARGQAAFRKVYRTGDLVRYRDDGAVVFVGRKGDGQVKLRGQRIELDEVAFQVESLWPRAGPAVAEIITPADRGSSSQVMVAFVKVTVDRVLEEEEEDETDKRHQVSAEEPTPSSTRGHEWLSPLWPEFQDETTKLRAAMSEHVPQYMIPRAFVPVTRHPVTTNGKLDRRALQEWASALSAEQLASYGQAHTATEKRKPSTAAEKALLNLLEGLFELPPGSIGIDDDFFQLGGDSVDAMRLVAAAGEAGMRLTVGQIFGNPQVMMLAKNMAEEALGTQTELLSSTTMMMAPPGPFTLLGRGRDLEERSVLIKAAAQQCGVEGTLIEDMYPCTALQGGLMATVAARQDGAYTAQHVFRLGQGVDVGRLQVAWAKAVSACEILRTRIVYIDGQGPVQVLVNQAVEWQQGSNLAEYLAVDKSQPMGYGTRLVRLAIVSESTDCCFLVWTAHHATYDGYSFALLKERVEQAYTEKESTMTTTLVKPPPPFSNFIRYLALADGAASDGTRGGDDYWRQQLGGWNGTSFPKLPSVNHLARTNRYLQQSAVVHGFNAASVTRSTLLRAAWAVTISRQTGSEDVVFGLSLSGRNAPVPDIANLVAPTIATVPLRLQLDNGKPLDQLLRQVQEHGTEMIPFEQTGLQHIRSLSEDAREACRFQSILAIQPAHKKGRHNSSDSEDNSNNIMVPHLDATNTAGFHTYPLVVECRPGQDSVEVETRFDDGVLSEWEVKRLIEQFVHNLQQLAHHDADTTLGDTRTLSSQQSELLREWNGQEPNVVNQCVHHTFQDQARKTPEAAAVASWDGQLTYRELDELSDGLAYRLSALGVGVGSLVPLCFEKSLWAVVSMLGVLKVGAAFVPMVPEHPDGRLETIVQDTNAKVVLTSEDQLGRLTGLFDNETAVRVLSISEQSDWTVSSDAHQDSGVQPSDLAVVIFTSGSTGRPKGVMLEHIALSTSMAAHGDALAIGPTSRVLQFAAFTFDISLQDILTTLTRGGCVCMPSEKARLDNLTAAINTLGANWAGLTPTVAALLRPDEAPGLKTLTLAGEAVTSQVLDIWRSDTSVYLHNCYGPAESTIYCSWQGEPGHDGHHPADIGRPLATKLWVADAADYTCPAPIGAAGELLIQGPTLARGYLNSAEQTASSFVELPAWIASMQQDEMTPWTRVYRTGDLVMYTEQGSLVYLGRKDTQIKIRGQRVELNEIEHQLQEDENIEAVMVLLPTNGSLLGRLTAVFSLTGEEKAEPANDGPVVVFKGQHINMLHGARLAAAQLLARKTREVLAEKLPSFMIPAVWLPLETMPRNTSGKLDRARITQWLADTIDKDTANKGILDDSMMAGGGGGQTTAAATPMEHVLQQVLASVLGVSVDQVSMSRSFLSHGGDSVTAIQLASRCRAQGVKLGVKDILLSPTLSQLATRAGAVSSSRILREEELNTPFTLSPIQRLYTDLNKKTPGTLARFNQSLVLRLTRRKEASQVARAIEALVIQHSMLRARFHVDEMGQWQQVVTSEIQGSFHFSLEDVSESFESSDTTRMNAVMAKTQERINPQTGPNMAVTMLETNEHEQLLFLAVSHMVMDLVSWHVVLHQLEQLLETGKMAAERSFPFQVWNKMQREYVERELVPETTLPFSLPPSDVGFWGLEPARNTWGDVDSVSFTLSEAITELLLSDASHKALGTEPVDILTAALFHSFHQVFPERELPVIYSEGHGREPWDADIDLSETVGWFTTMRPVVVSKSDDVIELLRQAKDARRSTPSNGWAYFASRYLHPRGQEIFDSNGLAEVLFNYLSRFQQLERPDALFQQGVARVSGFKTADVAPETPRMAAIDVSASVERGRLSLSITYSKAGRHIDRITKWAKSAEQVLMQLSELLPNRQREYTISDLPLLKLTQNKHLAQLVNERLPALGIASIDDVEDVYPCSPLQHGILVSQAKNAGYYKTQFTFDAKTRTGTQLSIEHLKEAWQAVVDRHSILRTVFTNGVTPDGMFCQVVLKHVQADIVLVVSDGGESSQSHEADSAVSEHKTTKTQLPACRLVINDKNQGGVAECRLEISHALVDGASFSVILGDLTMAYEGSLSARARIPLYRDYIAYLSTYPHEKALAYWEKSLRGLDPCHFPRLADTILPVSKAEERAPELGTVSLCVSNLFERVQAFCSARGVTTSNIIHAAWAIVLRTYTGSDDVCFGYLTAGRDIPVQDIEDIVGPFTNILTARLTTPRDEPLSALVEASKHSYVQALPYQATSMAQVQHVLGLSGQALFNTAVSLQTYAATTTSHKTHEPELHLRTTGGFDPTEVGQCPIFHSGRQK